MEFEQRLKPFYNDAVRFARSLAGSRSNGDDLLQESLIKAWRAYPRLKDADRFKSWLLKIFSNTNISRSRLLWIKKMVGLEKAEFIPNPDTLPYEEREVVRMALRELPVVQREALVMFEVLQMSVAEVASSQNVSQSAVKSRLARGRTRLRAEYEKLSNTEAVNEQGIIQVS